MRVISVAAALGWMIGYCAAFVPSIGRHGSTAVNRGLPPTWDGSRARIASRSPQVPPYMMGEVTAFTIDEVVNESILQALDAHSLDKVEGEEGNATLNQEAEDLQEAFKPGKPLVFSCDVLAKNKEEVEGSASEA